MSNNLKLFIWEENNRVAIAYARNITSARRILRMECSASALKREPKRIIDDIVSTIVIEQADLCVSISEHNDGFVEKII